MVAFSMSEQDAAALVADVFRRKPLPNPDGPQTFEAVFALLGMTEPKEVERFGEKCGVRGLRVFKVPVDDEPLE